MKISRVLQVITTISLTIALWLFPVASILAADNQSNQSMHQSALLVAPDPRDRISVYPQPNTRHRRVGYGMSGDQVTILEQVGSNDGYTWNYVKFDAPPYLKGWIREDAISQATPSPGSNSQVKQPSVQVEQPLKQPDYNSRDRPFGYSTPVYQDRQGNQQYTNRH